MRKALIRQSSKTAALFTLLIMVAPELMARNIYMNGIDISSARHQALSNVSIRIDGDGNVFIEAPHYQVHEENTFIPLSSWNREVGAPAHQPAGAMPARLSKAGGGKQPAVAPASPPAAAPPARDPAATEPKAGTKQEPR